MFPSIRPIHLLAELQKPHWPPSPWEWTLFASFFVAIVLIVVLYIRDARRLNPLWTAWLLLLRLAVFAGLIVIALNPRDRVAEKEVIPSRIVLLVDTSASMDFRERNTDEADGTTPNRKRSEAVLDVLEKSPLLQVLKNYHAVTVYTFDKKLHRPPVLTLNPKPESDDDSGDKKPESKSSSKARTTDPWKRLRKPEGLETGLGEALQEVMRLQKGETLSAVIVISDGQSNYGIDPKAANAYAKLNKIRLFTVGVGSTLQPVNLRIASINAPSEVNRGDPYDVTVILQGHRLGSKGERVQVALEVKKEGDPDTEFHQAELYKEPEAPDHDVVQLPVEQKSVQKTFTLKPPEPGKYEYRVTLKPLFQVDEFRKDDNIARHRLNVIERNIGVLLIAGGPMREYRFVRDMLYRNKTIDVDVWLQTVDPKNIDDTSQDADDVLTTFPESFPIRPKSKEPDFDKGPESQRALKYDAVIAFDPNWTDPRFRENDGLKKLERWMSSQAGGLIVVAGDVNTHLIPSDEELSMVRDFYPVSLGQLIVLDTNAKFDKPIAFEFTDAARGVSFLNLADETDERGTKPKQGGNAKSPFPWSEFDGFYRCYPTEGQKAGAQVYSYFNDPAFETKPILIAAHDYGIGRVIYLGTPEFWRLRDVDVDYYDRFWIKTLREAVKRRLGRSEFGTIALLKDEYSVGDTVRVEANLLTQDNNPLNVPSVHMNVIRPDGTAFETPVELLRDDTRKGFYVGDFTVRDAGTYQIQVNNPAVETRNRISAAVPVRFSQTESLQPTQNADVLTALPRETGGGYLKLEDFRTLFIDAGNAEAELEKLRNGHAGGKQVHNVEKRLETARTKIANLFPDRRKERQTNEQINELWDLELVILLMVAALSIEWLTRKLLKLA